jgi:pimeloyl-ACP methyl ester carboxylesterase
MRLHHGLVALLAPLLLVLVPGLAGCTSFSETAGVGSSAPASSSSAEPAAAPIEWDDCNEKIQPLIAAQPGSDRDLSFSCGWTDVPISYDEPGGDTLPLFVMRVVMAGQTERIGSLMVNPGGLSTPVECISDEMKERIVAAEPRPTTDEQLDDAFALAQEVGDGCTEEYGTTLGTFNTVDTARDMDQLRESLGDEQLSYLGYSYGTTLGSTYAELFPDRVRAMVLDAAVDPDADELGHAEESAKAFEAGFDAFAANCTGLIAGCPLGPEPRQFVEALLGQAGQTPIPSSQAGETRKATPGVVLSAIQSGLYGSKSWPQLAQSLAAAQKGDAAGLFSLADSQSGRMANGKYSNLIDANVAVNCADSEETFGAAEVRDLARDWSEKYPLFGAGSATGLYTCSAWEAERTPLPERDAEGSAPILVVGNSGDPVTPLPGAVDLAEDLASGVLLTWQGQGHTAYPKSDCVTAAVNAYLVNLTAPLDGLTCPA